MMPEAVNRMKLKVVTPTKILLDEDVRKVVADAPNGSFAMLPRHIDFVSELTPGVLVYETTGGEEKYFGVNEGTLVKCADTVFVSTRDAIAGDSLQALQEQVKEAFLQPDEQERIARTALARLEAGIVKRFIDLEKSVS